MTTLKWFRIFNSLEEARQKVPDRHTQLLIIRGIRICLVNLGESFKAIQDSCPHRGASLTQGRVNYLNEIVCPLHDYQFSLLTGIETNQRCGAAKTYPVKAETDGLFVGIKM